ncbi:MAG TPA: low affinity iron permease family protein [Pseudolabrys sp.]|nr:low affinity iron permease family protein [Pseudolabrys sp.]
MAGHKKHPHKGSWLSSEFSHLAQTVATWSGHPIGFMLACAVVIAWIVTGPLFDYSDTWQLVINTGTTIVTFLMVFLIQNTQNRDMLAVQLKLSELVLAMKGAENRFAAVEDLTDEELQDLHDQCKRRAEQTLTHIEDRRSRSTKNGTRNGHTGENHRAAAARTKSSRKAAAGS